MIENLQSFSNPYVVCIAVLLTLIGVSLFGSPKRRYPPGPPAKPLVGNILDVSPQGAWIKFTQYQDVYGLSICSWISTVCSSCDR